MYPNIFEVYPENFPFQQLIVRIGVSTQPLKNTTPLLPPTKPPPLLNQQTVEAPSLFKT